MEAVHHDSEELVARATDSDEPDDFYDFQRGNGN
jgi:hypothetical protein